MQRNSYCSLKAPSFFSTLRNSSEVFFLPTALNGKSASNTNLAARMASRQTLHLKLGKLPITPLYDADSALSPVNWIQLSACSLACFLARPAQSLAGSAARA